MIGTAPRVRAENRLAQRLAAPDAVQEEKGRVGGMGRRKGERAAGHLNQRNVNKHGRRQERQLEIGTDSSGNEL